MHVKSTTVSYADFSLRKTTAITKCFTNPTLHPPFINCWIFTIHPEGILSSTPVFWYTRGAQLSSCSSHEPVPVVEVKDVITDTFVDFVVYRAITTFEDLIIATLIRNCSKKGKTLSSCSALLLRTTVVVVSLPPFYSCMFITMPL